MPKSKLVDLSAEGERSNEFVLLLRARTDGRRATWACRLWVPPNQRSNVRNPYVLTSLDTLDQVVARQKAYRWRREYEARKNPASVVPLFKDVAADWINSLRASREAAKNLGQRALSRDQFNRWKSVTRRYLIPYFGLLPINDIPAKNCLAYGEWRRDFYVSGPGGSETHIEYQRGGVTVRSPVRKTVRPARSTISKDVEAFNKIVAFAQAKHPMLPWGARPLLEKATLGSREPAPRQRFTRQQVQLIFKKSKEWIEHETSSAQKRFDRAVLAGLIQFLWLTGARTSEAIVLKVGDVIADAAEAEYEIPDGDEVGSADTRTYYSASDFKVRFPGIKRVSHKRIAIPRLEFEKFYCGHGGALKSRFLPDDEYADLEGLPPSLPLFPTWDGERLSDVGKRHDRLLDFSVSKKFPNGLRKIDSTTMSLSCWRHTYASEMIEAFAREKHPNMVAFLARNMGTSQAMIERYYGHLLPEFAKDGLRI